MYTFEPLVGSRSSAIRRGRPTLPATTATPDTTRSITGAGVGVACHAMIAGSPATRCGSQCSLALGNCDGDLLGAPPLATPRAPGKPPGSRPLSSRRSHLVTARCAPAPRGWRDSRLTGSGSSLATQAGKTSRVGLARPRLLSEHKSGSVDGVDDTLPVGASRPRDHAPGRLSRDCRFGAPAATADVLRVSRSTARELAVEDGCPRPAQASALPRERSSRVRTHFAARTRLSAQRPAVSLCAETRA
jgi:hypothetical protein